MLFQGLEKWSQIQLPDRLSLLLSCQQYPKVSIITLVSTPYEK
jgi:hypothetical protein